MATTLTQAKTFWTGLPAARRRLLLAVGALTMVGLLLAAALSSRPPQYAPLFTNLAPSDAAAIVARLGTDKVPYKLLTDGSTISVPQAQVAQLRLQMAAAGLPNSGVVGLSLINKLGFSATNFEQHVAYLRALQGELEQTISQIDGVQSDRVHIVLPKTQIFSDTAPKATAAVLVRLRAGASLSASQVGAIQHLVASSVQGLKPSGVTVVDQQGQLLSGGGSSQGSPTATSGDLQLQQQFQQRLQTSLDHLLSQVFGLGNVVTHVQAQLNFDSQTVTQNLFTPAAKLGKGKQGLLQSLNSLKEQFKGTGGLPGALGVPGTASNSVPTYPAVGATNGKSNYTKSQTNQRYAVDETQKRTVVAPGAVKRLSVAVVINRQLTPAQQQAVVQTVSAAIGADPARHDLIDVVGMPFSNSLAKQLSATPARPKPNPQPLLVYESAAGAAVLLLAVLWAVLRARRRNRREEEEEEARLAAELLSKAKGENGPRPPAFESMMDLPLRERVERRPQDVAAILRLWMSEE